MHSTFRVIGQQMGMQLVRAILPESIDVFLNDAILEKVRTDLIASVSTQLQTSPNQQPSGMTNFNSLRTLHRTARYAISDTPKVLYYNADNGYYIIAVPTVGSDIELEDGESEMNAMQFLGFSIEYKNTLRGNPIYCRLVSPDILETSLRDFSMNADKDCPIATLTSDSLEIFTNTKDCDIKFLNVKYVNYPNTVKYSTSLDECVNCNLPDYVHYEVVENAVGKFYNAMGVGMNNKSK